MDSIELIEKVYEKKGKPCKIVVSTGDVYSGIFLGAIATDPETALVVRLKISKNEAERIGCPWLPTMDIPFDVIKDIKF